MVVPSGVTLDFQNNLYTEGMTVPKAAEGLIPQPKAATPAPAAPAQAQSSGQGTL